jgi:phosphatidylglycerophosphate synthase
MQADVRRHAANVLTLMRVALAPAFACAVVAAARGASGWWAALLFAAVAGSDAADGYLARRLGTASAAGRALDHGADILFLLTALGTYAGLGVIPWWVPAAVMASFGGYVVDARWPPPAPPRWGADRIGHLGGVANWVLVGVLVGNHTVGLGWLPPPLILLLCAIVALYSAAAIAGRLAARR